MAKQIILTQNDYGIELETQFVNDKKKPLDITDYDIRVKIIYNNETIDIVLAGHKDNTNGIAYIVLEKEHLLNAGLYTTIWSVVDEDEHITAQENLYYFVKDVIESEDDTPTTDLPIDADGILNKFKEVDDDLLALNKHTDNIYNELNHYNEHLDDIDIELKNIDKTIKIIEENNVTPDIQIGTITTLESNQKPTVTRRGTDKNPIFDFGIPRGTQGREGVEGKKGKQGIPGKDGITPNISIGTVTTLEAGKQVTVVNSGTKENPIFDFGIPKGADSVAIDDTVISKDKTWSSSKISDFVLTNDDDVIWSTVQGENLSIDYTKEGYLREVEIWGNTIQNEEDLSNIQHLGELYVDDKGQPILDSEGRKQYKVEVVSLSTNLGEYELEVGALSYNTGLNVNDNTKFRTKDFIKIDNWLIDSYQNITNNYGYNDMFTYIFYDKNQQYIRWRNIIQLKKTEIPINAEYFKFFTLYRTGVLDEKTFQSNVFYSSTPNTSYIPPKSHKTTLLLPCQLMKVGGISDRLYWDNSKGRYVVEKYILATKLLSFRSKYGKFFQEPQIEGKFNSKNIDGGFIYRHGQVAQGFEHNGYNASAKTKGNLALSFYSDVLGRAYPHAEEDWTLKDVNNYIGEGKDLYAKLITPQLIETNITEQILLPCYKDKTHLFITSGIGGSIKAKAPVDGGKAIQSLNAKNTALTLENAEMKETNIVQDELINTTMLATDEMYMMLEPLLAETLSKRSTSKMVDMYVAMMQRGIKTIEQVPVRYREQVRKILDQLEK